MKKNTWKQIIMAFLTACGLSVVFSGPLARESFETGIDYAIASVYQLLGEYDFRFVLIFVLSIFFFRWLSEQAPGYQRQVPAAVPVIFSVFLLVGRSCQETGSWNYCFGSAVNFIKFVLALAGYSVLLGGILNFLSLAMEKNRFTNQETHFWSRHGFGKAFAILCGAYLPFLILAYPGKLCWDALGQITQVTGGGFSQHHPLLHTLLMGGMTELGNRLLGSRDFGLFCYMLLQLGALAAALASTVAVLAKRHMKKELLWALVAIYCITPVYSNMASTALKDVPYSAAVVGYVVCLALLLEDPERLKKSKFAAGFALLQILVILLRNNGIYVVVISGVVILICLIKKYGWKSAGVRFLGIFGGSAAAGRILMLLLAVVCQAAPGSRGEMLSIPFQQTARYLQLYRDEISQEERAAVEAVLGDVELVAGRYDPKSSDPVKALFRKEASGGELFAYLKQWGHGLIRHPKVYVEAFLMHIYGWFSPEVSNSTRYEAEYDLVRQGGLFPNAEKLLIFYYRFAARFTPLGILENIGLAVWALIFLTVYQKKHGRNIYMAAGMPLWVTLLVCMASPGFLGHARYGFPILFSILFLYGFTLTAESIERRAEI